MLSETPSKSLAYLLLVIMFPVIGIFFYLSVGFNYRKRKLYRKKLEIDEHTYPELETKVFDYSQMVVSKRKEQLGHYFPLANLRSDKMLISANNKVELLINGEKKFPSVLEDLRNAKHHIHLEYYIYENDTIGNEIADILIKKTREGVKVRFIYDDFGSQGIRRKFVRNLRNAGIETVPFYKINLIQFANRLNYRNHRKIIVIDGEIGYLGGINVSDKYINDKNTKLYWRDTHLKITGISVLNLQFIFLTDWNFCSKQNIGFTEDYFPLENRHKEFGNQLAQIIASGPDSDYQNTMYSLMQSIMLAKNELLITTPYFIPDKSFIDALKIAALSGVDVKLLVPGISDSYIVNATSQSYYEELLVAGVKIYRYQKGFVHAKTLVCDRKIATVGTVNLDIRSFDLNFELNAVVFDENLALQLTDQFFNDLEDAVQLRLDEWKNRPLLQKFIEKTLQLFSSLM